MNFVFKMLVAKYGKQLAEKLYAEYKAKKRTDRLSAKRQRGQQWTLDDD